MVNSAYKKQRIVYYRLFKACKPPVIKKLLQEEGIMKASEKGN